MANIPPPPPGQSPGIDPKILSRAFRDLLEDQGDYNNILKNVLSDLKKMDTAYGKIESRLASLNSDSINIKQVNQELLKLRQKEFIEQKKLTDLNNEYSDATKQDLELAKQMTANIVDRNEREMAMMGLLNNLEAAGLYAAEKQVEYATAKRIEGEKYLKTEKEVQRQLGISGNFMKIFADKLGVGEDAYAAMSLKARQLVESQKDMSAGAKIFSKIIGAYKVAFAGIGSIFKSAITNIFDPAIIVSGVIGAFKLAKAGLDAIGSAASKAGNFIAGFSEDSSNVVRGLTSGFSDLAKQIPFVGGLIGGLIEGFSAILDLVIGIDNKIIKSGRDLNLNTQQARALNREFQDISFYSGNVFVNSKKLLESQVELSNQLGVVNRLTTEQLETNIMLKDIAGLELDTRQQITEASTITGKTSENVVKSVLAQVQGLKNATGIQFQNKQVLKEAANLGGYLGLQFAKYPANLTKSLVTVKAMGMELKQLDSIADSFLDFESSLSKEFEAQLLTGKDINLAKAREAFLNNDLATAASEITRQVGSAKDFLKLKRIEAESLASAFGMSRDQLGEMLKKQELLSRLGAKDTDNAQKQLQLGLQKFKNQEALVAAIGEEAYQNLLNASTQEKITGYIDKIKQSIVDFIERTDLISKIEKFVKMLQDPEAMQGILGKIRDTISVFIKVAGELLADILEVGGSIADFFTPFSKRDYSDEAKVGASKVRSFSAEMAANVKSLGLNFSPVSVGDNAANSQVKNSQGAAAAPQDNMSMAKPTKETININGKFYVVDSKRENEYRVERVPNLDDKTGK
jgi:hypothetical protein